MGDYSRRSRGGGEDRFYSPPAMRRQNQLLKNQLQDQKQLTFGPVKRVGSVTGSDDGVSSTSSIKTTTATMASVPAPAVDNMTNLDRFVEHTTPSVPAHFFSKASIIRLLITTADQMKFLATAVSLTLNGFEAGLAPYVLGMCFRSKKEISKRTSMREWRNYDGELNPYFVLGDLWESFKEWSAYGAGVPLILDGNESVVQYYVPFLSGIQLYIDPSRPVMMQRRPGEESDADSSRETCSDSSGEIGADGGVCNIQGTQREQNANTLAQGLSRIALTNNPSIGLSSDENEIKNPPGLLIFEYFAHDPPHTREPLVDKISQLASQFPDLKTYRSCDLTPASWISVAWYPIYRIPMGPTLQSLDACFLTYHSLSTPLRSKTEDWPYVHGSAINGRIQDMSMPLSLPLPTFGLASYRFRISFWNHSGDYEPQKAGSLKQAAENWLRLLQVTHPDYRWFEDRRR